MSISFSLKHFNGVIMNVLLSTGVPADWWLPLSEPQWITPKTPGSSPGPKTRAVAKLHLKIVCRCVSVCPVIDCVLSGVNLASSPDDKW